MLVKHNLKFGCGNIIIFFTVNDPLYKIFKHFFANLYHNVLNVFKQIKTKQIKLQITLSIIIKLAKYQINKKLNYDCMLRKQFRSPE